MNLPFLILAAIPALIIFRYLLPLHGSAFAPAGRGSDSRSKFQVSSLFLAHELFTIPVLLAFIASLVTGKYWLQPKYLIFSAPFALLFIAIAYLSIERAVLRRITAWLGLAIFAIAMLHFWNPQDYGRRENWRSAAEFLSQSLDQESALVLVPSSYRLLTYYAPGIDRHWVIVNPPESAAAAAAFENDTRAKLSGKREIYYLRYDVAQNIEDPRDLVPMVLDNLGQRSGTLRFNPRFSLLRWVRVAD